MATANNTAARFEVIDRHTAQRVGKLYSTRVAASRAVDRLDNAYGAYRYFARSIATCAVINTVQS